MKEPQHTQNRRVNACVAVVGSGGNIGSHLVGLLARRPEVRRVLLVDQGRYEEKNLTSQDIRAADVGKPKVRVQKERLARIRPDLDVKAIHAGIEAVPRGNLRADVILSGLDSLESRQSVNEIVWRLNVPWIDAGVRGTGRLARVTIYRPGLDRPCLECAWDHRQYDNLRQTCPCDGGGQFEAPATRAPAALGALAASLAAIEFEKMMSGEAPVQCGREIVFDALNNRCLTGSRRRNPDCRFDHEPWAIDRVEIDRSRATLRDLFSLLCRNGKSANASLSIEGDRFVSGLTCRTCGATRRLLRLRQRLPTSSRHCRHCGGAMIATGIELRSALDFNALSAHHRATRLASIGLDAGDILTIQSDSSIRHIELVETSRNEEKSMPDRGTRSQATPGKEGSK